jgi:hypothetical protein
MQKRRAVAAGLLHLVRSDDLVEADDHCRSAVEQ